MLLLVCDFVALSISLLSCCFLPPTSQAFTDALNSADLDLVTWVAHQAATGRTPLPTITSQLSGIIQLCLVQQLSQQLELHTVLKLVWLDALTAQLKRDDPVVQPHIPGVMGTVRCIHTLAFQ